MNIVFIFVHCTCCKDTGQGRQRVSPASPKSLRLSQSSLAEKSGVRTRSRCANPLAVRESEAFALRLSATAT